MSWLKILMIRHGMSLGNQAGRMMGQLDDALSPEGERQAQQLAAYLVQYAGRPTAIYSSPLERAAQTAACLAEPLNMTVTYHVGLKELHGGIFQGLTWAEAKQRYPQKCKQLESSLGWIPVPEAESPQDGYQRAIHVLRELTSRHANGDDIWVVSHAGLMQHLISALLGSDRSWGMAIAHTSMFEFWIDHDRWSDHGPDRWNTERWKIRRFNDTEHLDQR